ncbi:hypothetical protein DFP72DRAFT_906224 [Ephemerocybe angulata]|uniref:Uncharacterized protein n=1 Tax=Ephemerocybe angulata TaxID=980116 RepID=A0A8H6HS34_9AGAR|nr:hypothetical protein DFP72DRAFT_906224 [Tulosesus angulatus]
MKSFTVVATFLLVIVSPMFVLARPIITEVPSEVISRDDEDDVYALMARNNDLDQTLVRRFEVQGDALIERRAGARATNTKQGANARPGAPAKKPQPKQGRPRGRKPPPRPANSPNKKPKHPKPAGSKALNPIRPKSGGQEIYNGPARPSSPTLGTWQSPPPKPSIGARIVRWGKNAWNRIKPNPRPDQTTTRRVSNFGVRRYDAKI